MKKIILLFCLLIPFTCLSQEFQWAYAFNGEVHIVNTACDSENNLYVFGLGHNSPLYRGEGVGYGNSYNAMLLKIDPEGNLVWKKLIYSSGSFRTTASAMQLVGDSMLVMLVGTQLAGANVSHYYLDTLVRPVWDAPTYYPFYVSSSDPGYGNAVVFLDKEGNLKEHHFIRSVQKDEEGVQHGCAYVTNMGKTPIFVDRDGCFYMTKKNNDIESYAPYISLIVDGDTLCRYKNEFPPNSPILFKFSPHLDSLIWMRSMVSGFDTANTGDFALYYSDIVGLTGNDDGIYLCGNFDYDYPTPNIQLDEPVSYYNLVDTSWHASILLDPLNPDARINVMYGHKGNGYLVKYDHEGNLLWNTEITATPDEPMEYIEHHSAKFYDIKLSDDRQQIILATHFYTGTFLDTTHFWNFILDADSSKNNVTNNAGFVTFNASDGSLSSYGVAQTSLATLYNRETYSRTGLAVRNNQIFTQVHYQRDLLTDDTIYRSGSDVNYALALVRFHDSGHTISAIDFHSAHRSNSCFPLAFDHDGNLLISGSFATSGTIGGNTLQGTYLAKLSDPTFNAPYTPEPREQSILWEQELTLPLAATAVPLTARATSGLPVAYTVEDPTVARLSHDTLLLLLAPGSTNIYADQPGDLWYLPAPQLARTLTVTTTPDPNAIAPVAPEEVLSVEYFDLLGRRLPASPARGLYLERTLTPTGVTTRKILKQ